MNDKGSDWVSVLHVFSASTKKMRNYFLRWRGRNINVLEFFSKKSHMIKPAAANPHTKICILFIMGTLL